MRCQRGQATVEWTALALLVALALVGLGSLAGRVDGRSFGGFLAHRLACAIRGGCDDGDRALARAYGDRGAALVRRRAPSLVYEPGERQLPVDYRRCRRPACAQAPDDRDLDAHRTASGGRATAFTRLQRRGGRTYVQYWLYYPDSTTAWAGSDRLWERSRVLPLLGRLVRGTPDYPGWHRDDWESVQVRVDRDGSAWTRASSHGHYQGCKWSECRDRWIEATGWSRVSRGSHAGHIPVERRDGAPPAAAGPLRGYRRLLPGRDLRERTTTAEGLRLVPLESLAGRGYRRLDPDIEPPWRKEAYRRPERDSS